MRLNLAAMRRWLSSREIRDAPSLESSWATSPSGTTRPSGVLTANVDSTSLLETGVLDSLSLLRLVVFIQERFGIVVDDVDLVPENFDTVDAICAYLRSLDGETAGRA